MQKGKRSYGDHLAPTFSLNLENKNQMRKENKTLCHHQMCPKFSLILVERIRHRKEKLKANEFTAILSQLK